MRKWIALLLSALMLFSLTACDEDKEKYDKEYERQRQEWRKKGLSGCSILIKGSRGKRLERVIEAL